MLKTLDFTDIPLANKPMPELVVDLFAGGGGASSGIRQAIGRDVDIAINHDPEAISVHTINHSGAVHYCSDVFEIDPVFATQGRLVGLLWASPDCKHFSKAKGAKPVDQRIRSLAWVVVNWAKSVRPRVIILENVEEFVTWGPLGPDNKPCPHQRGRTFSIWIAQLRQLGYVVEFRELRACDYGAPTSRKRLFVIARCDGQPIVWPEPTHAKPNHDGKVSGGLQTWRTAAECIDFTLPCPSIFERKRPLADATCRRIAKGIVRYVLQNPKPFIVSITHRGGGERTEPVDEPMRTITASKRGEKAVVSATLMPFIVQYDSPKHNGDERTANLKELLPTQTTENRFALVSAFLSKHNSGAITSIDHYSLATANLVHMGHGEGKDGNKRFSHGIRNIEEPVNTITASGIPSALVTSHLIKLRNNQFGQNLEQPLPTLTAGGGHYGEIRAFLVKYYGTSLYGSDLFDPLSTVTGKARMALVTVTVNDEAYVIADIGLRMMTPKELYRAQGFPDDYIFERGAQGEPITKTAQIRKVGNSVCPPIAQRLVESNYATILPETVRKPTYGSQ